MRVQAHTGFAFCGLLRGSRLRVLFLSRPAFFQPGHHLTVERAAVVDCLMLEPVLELLWEPDWRWRQKTCTFHKFPFWLRGVAIVTPRSYFAQVLFDYTA